MPSSQLRPADRRWLRQLKESFNVQGGADDAERLWSIYRLVRARGKRHVRRALNEGSPAVRAAALELLTKYGPSWDAEAAGLRFCHDANPEVRLRAICALGRSRTEKGLEALLALFADPAPAIHRPAGEVLKGLWLTGTNPRLRLELEAQLDALSDAEDALEDARGAARQAGRTAAKAGTPASAPARGPSPAVARAREHRAAVQRHVERLIDVLGNRTTGKNRIAEELAPLLRHRGPCRPDEGLLGIAWATVLALKQLGVVADEALPALVTLLDAPEPELRTEVVRVLGWCALPRRRSSAVPTLLERAGRRDAPGAFVEEVIRMLPPHAKEHGDAVLAFLRDALRRPSDWQRRLAVAALAEIGPPRAREAVPDLLEALRRGDAFAFSRTGEPLVLVDPEGTETIPALVRMLRDPDVEVRARAAQALGEYGPKAREAAGVLRKLSARRGYFGDYDSALALAAIEAEP